MHAASRAEKETKRKVRETFREVGDIVKVEAAERFREIDERSAAGYRTVVRRRGVSVEQSLRRTTGQRPDFGALQMRTALEPALEAKEGEVTEAMEDAVDEIADHFER